jgi:transcriptional regulator with XRE-family HTH domain
MARLTGLFTVEGAREARLAKLWSVDLVAQLCGVSTHAVRAAEKGRPVQMRTARRLAEVLDLPAEKVRPVYRDDDGEKKEEP